jgi:signal peptidase II
MRRVSSFWGKNWRTIVFFLAALAVAIGDQASKAWIRDNIRVNDFLPEEGFLRFTHVQNTGAAFGIFPNHTFPLTIVSFIGAAVILFYTFYVRRRYTFLNNGVSMAALGVVLGGTIGNLIDRLSLGYVTDFILVGTFPAFNVADSSITSGTSVFAGFLIYLLVREKHEARGEQMASHNDGGSPPA